MHIFRSVSLLLFTALPLVSQGFTPIAPMNEARESHTVTWLNNGKLLVTGGGAIRGDSAELFEPATGLWRFTGSPMNAARYNHRATLLADGRVLITGGHSGVGFTHHKSAEVYDPLMDTFTLVAPMANRHGYHEAFRLSNGKVMVIAGRSVPDGPGGATASCELFDPVSGAWAPAASLPFVMADHKAVQMPDDRILVFGGWRDDTFTTLNTVFAYTPATNTWQAMTPMLVPRGDSTATLLSDNKILIAGGISLAIPQYSSVELYDPDAVGGLGQSTLVNSLSSARRLHRAVLMANGNVMIVGGAANGVGSLASGEIYDRATGAWLPAGNMTHGRQRPAAIAMGSGVLVAGGGTWSPDFTSGAHQASVDVWLPPLTVQIDIKPGAYPNSINLGSSGTVPVAVLSSATFDATTVNPLSVTLAGATVKLKGQGTPMSSVQDVNNDGLPDLVVHVSTEALQLSAGDTLAILSGSTFGGQAITGSDTVRIVP